MDLSLEKLKEAVSIREQIQSLEQRLSSLFGNGVVAASGKIDRRRRPMSAATRAKLAASAKARWAKSRAGSDAGKPSAKTAKRKSGITAAGRRKLAEAMKARWAERRKAAAKNK